MADEIRKPLLATKTFLKEYDRASGPLADAAEQEVQFLVRRIAEEPKTWLQRYDKVSGLKGMTVLELELGGGPRLLVHVNGAVTLWRLGDHEVTTRARRFGLDDIDNAVAAPSQFSPTVGLHGSSSTTRTVAIIKL